MASKGVFALAERNGLGGASVDQPGGHPPGHVSGGTRALEALPEVLQQCLCNSQGFPMDAG